tara:strand:+ start:879 stop:1874 length:996 start_codon:yes stop_codon:yes gene_type:complete
MALNIPLAFKMGLARKLERDSEKENALKDRIAALNDRKREWLFQSYMTGSADRKKSVKARASMIKQAVTDGFSKESATLLEASGELGDHLSRISKLKEKGEYNRERVKAMDKLVINTLKRRPKEEQIAALKYIAQGNLNYEDESEFQDEFINAIFSANPDSLQKATEIYSDVMSSGGGGLDFGPTGLSTRVLGDYSATMRAQIDKAIAQNVAGYLSKANLVQQGDSYSWTGADAGAAQDIVREMAAEVEKRYYDPEETGDWKSVIGIMAENIGKQANVPNLKVSDYKVSTLPDFVPPTSNPNTLPPPPLDSGAEPEDDEDDETILDNNFLD